MKITNNTDETITIEPGEEIDTFGSIDRIKVMAKRETKVLIREIKQ